MWNESSTARWPEAASRTCATTCPAQSRALRVARRAPSGHASFLQSRMSSLYGRQSANGSTVTTPGSRRRSRALCAVREAPLPPLSLGNTHLARELADRAGNGLPGDETGRCSNCRLRRSATRSAGARCPTVGCQGAWPAHARLERPARATTTRGWNAIRLEDGGVEIGSTEERLVHADVESGEQVGCRG